MTQSISGMGITPSPESARHTASQCPARRMALKTQTGDSGPPESRPRLRAVLHRGSGRRSSGRQRRYFVHMLVGVYPSHEVAMLALGKNEFARSLPVAVERNCNGLGQCKVWLAVSKPYSERGQAQEAQRRLVPFVGNSAVAVRMED